MCILVGERITILTVLSPENSVLAVLVKPLSVKLLIVVVKLLCVSDRHKRVEGFGNSLLLFCRSLI